MCKFLWRLLILLHVINRFIFSGLVDLKSTKHLYEHSIAFITYKRNIKELTFGYYTRQTMSERFNETDMLDCTVKDFNFVRFSSFHHITLQFTL